MKVKNPSTVTLPDLWTEAGEAQVTQSSFWDNVTQAPCAQPSGRLCLGANGAVFSVCLGEVDDRLDDWMTGLMRWSPNR